MKCPNCKVGELRQDGMLSHNWRCELCGKKQWSSAMNSPGSGSQPLPSGRSTYFRPKSYSSKQVSNTNRIENKKSKSSGLADVIGTIIVIWILIKIFS